MTYEQVAKDLDVAWCQGAGALGRPCLYEGNPKFETYHRFGKAQVNRGIVHWTDRRLHRPGLYNFLKLVGSCRKNHNRGQPTWQQIYERNVWATAAARSLGIRVRRAWTVEDRARVRWLTLNAASNELLEKARRWARR